MTLKVVDGGYITYIFGSSSGRWRAWNWRHWADAIVAMDGGKLDRLVYYEGYKATRTAKRHENHEIYQRHQLVKAFRGTLLDDPRVNTLMIPGLEADDIIALLAWECERPYVIGQDKDLLQLMPFLSGIENFDKQQVTGQHLWKKYPVTLGQAIPKAAKYVPLYLAIMGDSSDGVPRLIPPRNLQQTGFEMEAADNRWEYALRRWGHDFIRNLRLVLLPFPNMINDLDDDELMDLVATGRYGPGALRHRVRADVLNHIREYLELDLPQGILHMKLSTESVIEEETVLTPHSIEGS